MGRLAGLLAGCQRGWLAGWVSGCVGLGGFQFSVFFGFPFSGFPVFRFLGFRFFGAAADSARPSLGDFGVSLIPAGNTTTTQGSVSYTHLTLPTNREV